MVCRGEFPWNFGVSAEDDRTGLQGWYFSVILLASESEKYVPRGILHPLRVFLEIDETSFGPTLECMLIVCESWSGSAQKHHANDGSYRSYQENRLEAEESLLQEWKEGYFT